MILTELMIQHALITMTDEPIKKKKEEKNYTSEINATFCVWKMVSSLCPC